MKLVVSVCVHNRIENIEEWIRCWRQCEQHNAELVIIHNHYGNQDEHFKFKRLCDSEHITYVSRSSNGYDIGAFKNVCENTLRGFPEWDLLLWCCDDTFPMRNDFISPFLKKLKDNIGVVCMEMSTEIRLHFRTSGFMIRKETAGKLVIPKIDTKDDCYIMEHRGDNSFFNQIVKMGLRVLMVDPPKNNPLWDTGYLNRQRMKEHFLVFPKNNKVTFICPMFDAFPEIISSLICQTHKHWELLLIDDNPEKTNTKDIIKAINDDRVTYIKRERLAKWGHPHRKWALKEIQAGSIGKQTDYIVVTNADNYYVPTFIEYMIDGFNENQKAIATYCKSIVHSYIKWCVLPCRLERGFLDCGGVMVKRSVACDVGWRDVDSHSSDWTYFEDIINKYGADSFVPVKGTLFVHN